MRDDRPLVGRSSHGHRVFRLDRPTAGTEVFVRVISCPVLYNCCLFSRAHTAPDRDLKPKCVDGRNPNVESAGCRENEKRAFTCFHESFQNHGRPGWPPAPVHGVPRQPGEEMVSMRSFRFAFKTTVQNIFLSTNLTAHNLIVRQT